MIPVRLRCDAEAVSGENRRTFVSLDVVISDSSYLLCS